MKTFRIPLVVLFLCAFFGLSPVEAETNTLKNLEQQGQQYVNQLLQEKGAVKKLQQAALLGQAADIMAEQDNCKAAVSLYRQSASFGCKRDTDFWLALAAAHACSKDWTQASRVGYLAYLKAANDSEKKIALVVTANALEHRATYYNNWNTAALEAYNRALQLEEIPEVQKRAAALQRKIQADSALKISNSSAETDSGTARLCISFNDSLQENGSYSDYIRTSPELKADFVIDYKELCIGGAAFNTRYQVTIRKGLKGEDKTLPATVQLSIETGHAPLALWFNQNDYILASPSSPAIGLHSMNVEKVQLELYRINERNILGDFVRENFREKLEQYEINRLKNEVGEQVWQGTTEIPAKKDVQTASSLVLPEEILTTPGLYVLIATGSSLKQDNWDGRASQWLVVTDIGLTSYRGSDGLTVIARSLATAKPLADIEIILHARNNSPLASLKTDASGQVLFAPGLLQGKGGRRAVRLAAMDSQYGFTFLNLEQAPFDLSDRGVAGRAAPGPLDAFVYLDRGIYRPGETLNMVALLRDQSGAAVQNPPLIMRVKDSMGKVTLERVLSPDSSGGYSNAVTLAPGARTGNWQVFLYVDTDEKPVGKAGFQVNAFKPPRLEVRLAAEGVVTPQAAAQVAVQADYLYGSPGSALGVESWLDLRYEPHPFAAYAGYFFGKSGEKPGLAQVELPPAHTNAQGQSVLAVDLKLYGNDLVTRQPLKAVLLVEVADIDGRRVAATTSLPVRHLKEYIGLKPGFSAGQVQAAAMADFSIIALDSSGQLLTTGTVGYRLIREEIDYQWFQDGGNWGYERIVRDHEAQRAELSAPFPADISLPVGQGSYRLELYGTGNILLSSYRFTAGEQLTGRSDTPDSVKVTLDRSKYQPGETAKLTIESPYPGEASLVLAGTAVQSVSNFSLHSSDRTHTLEIPVQAEWGAGVYAMVTVYRPGDDRIGGGKGAGRAMGLVWLGVDPAGQRLEVAINSPDKTRPRQTLQIPVTVSGAAAGTGIHLTLTAVDDGVLQMTGFTAPDPLAWFFGKQELGLEIRDQYGQLITAPNSKPLVLRTGAGDDEGIRGMPKSNVRVVSLFSGVVQAGADGTVSIPLKLPDFNGRLRLMAVAWTKGKMGAANRELQVNDPVVISASLPRYLARDDQSSVQLLLDNVDGPEGEYHLQWSADGSLIMEGEFSADVVLKRGKRQSRSFPVFTDTAGDGMLHLRVTGPEGYSYAGDYSLNVRDKYLPVLRRTFSRLAPGESLTLDHGTVQGLVPQTAEVKTSVSSSPNLDVVGLLDQLDRYPYGCLEQLTSRAMPLLYANLLASRYNVSFDRQLDSRINKAIELIFQKQRSNGGFSLWNDFGGTEKWLSVYAMDFMSRARDKGYFLPDYFYAKGMGWLSEELKAIYRPGKEELVQLAYASWVLARAGQGRLEDSRYLFDTYLDKLPTSLAQAQVAGAMALQGDLVRAEKGFKSALRATVAPGAYWHNYGSRLRDLAAILSVLDESGLKNIDPAPLWQELTRQLAKEKYLSTQEQAWLVMAALTLGSNEPLQLDIIKDRGRTTVADRSFFTMKNSGTALLAKPVMLKNNGGSAAWVVSTAEGAPDREPEPVKNGFSVWRQWYSMDGKPISMETISQGEMVVVVLEGRVAAGADYKALLVDLLPAGVEIEKTGLDGGSGFLFWLGDLTPTRYEDGLDDRFVAAFDTDQLKPVQTKHDRDREKPFRLAYLARAVTPGSYTVPPVEVEAMYQPAIRGRSKAAKVVIQREKL